MIKKNNSYRYIFIIIFGFMAIILVSCSSQLKPLSEVSEEESENEPPSELKELKQSIEDIEKKLTSMYKEKEKLQQGIISSNSKGEDSNQQEQEGIQNNEQQNNQQGGQQGNQQEQIQIELNPNDIIQFTKQQQIAKNQEELMKKQKETLEKFEELKKDVLELHGKWNSYEPKAVEAFASEESIKEFEKSLDNLTSAIQTRDEYINLLAVNELYKTLPDFYELYTTEEPPDLDRLNYSVKKIKLLAKKDDYNSMNPTLEYLTNVWTIAKPKLKKDITDLINKFEFALKDLKSAIENKNSLIIDAKSEVLTKIITEIIESLQK